MPVFGYAPAFIFLATAIHLVDSNYGEYVCVYKCLHCSHSKGNLIPTDLGCYTSYPRTAREDAGMRHSINIYSRANITREAFIYLNYFDSKLIHSHFFLFDPMSTDRGYAIPGEDFEFQNITRSSRFFNFTISPGVSKRFDVTIINDSLADYYSEPIRLIVGIYVPGGRNHCCSASLYIEDDDGKL